MRYIGPALVVALIAMALTGAGCVHITSKIPNFTSPTPTTPSLPSGPPFSAATAGSVVTTDVFNESYLTLFLIIENVTSLPQAFMRADVVLYDAEGRQLGTRYWGSRPIILDPHMKVPIALTFEGPSEWARVKVSFSETPYDQSRYAYTGLRVLESEIASDGKEAKVVGTIVNAGSSSALDMTAIVLGFDNAGNIVTWGYSYPVQTPLLPGSKRGFETRPLQGDPTKMGTHNIYLYGQASISGNS